MADQRLTLLVEAKNRASRTLKAISGDVKGLTGSVLGANKAFLGLGVSAGVAGLAKVSFELAKASAASVNTEEAFRRLAAEMGISADAMLDAMWDASKGTIEATTLMANANKAMAMGLAVDAETMSTLMMMASERAKAFGITTEEAFTRIITGSAKMRNELLDEIGVVVDAETAYDDFAKQLGVTASELSTAGKQAAFLQAVMAAGQSDVAAWTNELTDAETIQTFATAVGELQDAVGKLVLESGLIDRVGKLADNVMLLADAANALRSTNLPGWMTHLSTAMKSFPGIGAVKNVTDFISELTGFSPKEQLQDFVDDTEAMENSQHALMQTLNGGSDAIVKAEVDTSRYIKTADAATGSTAKLDKAVSELTSTVSGLISAQLGDTAGIDADDLLPDAARIDENARRLADIAVNGFTGQDWLGAFVAEVPSVYGMLRDAADPKAAAAQLLDDFQDGLLGGTDVLLDKELIKEQAWRKILGAQNLERVSKEIAQELADAHGLDFADAMEAVTGVTGGGTGGGTSMKGAIASIDGSRIPELALGLPCVPLRGCIASIHISPDLFSMVGEGMEDSLTANLDPQAAVNHIVGPMMDEFMGQDLGGAFGLELNKQIEQSAGTFEAAGRRGANHAINGFVEQVMNSEIDSAFYNKVAGEILPIIRNQLAFEQSVNNATSD